MSTLLFRISNKPIAAAEKFQFIRYFVAVNKKKSPVVKNKSKGSRDEKQAENDAIQSFIKFAEEAKKLKLEFSEEEKAEHTRIGREYQRQMTLRHNRVQKDLTNKIWLQQEAMRALPPDLYAHAIITDDTPPPADRPWPVWDTPPIKGFNPQDYMQNDGDGDDSDNPQP